MTGHYLLHKDAGVIFFSVGFLASASLLYALWRRYFAELSLGTVVAGALALGLASFAPAVLARCDVYEVAISAGYAFAMLALVGIWGALHQPRRAGRWLAMASLAYGLAVGARPSLLFGAIILLVPVARAWREKQRAWPLSMAAAGPIMLIGMGLMLYNNLRFDNPLEFGQRYQLPLSREDTWRQFGLHYLWFNFRVAFLEPARWSSRFPFVHDITLPLLPKGADVADPFGVLTNIPLVWLALAVPLAWRGRSVEVRSTLRWFLAAAVVLFGTCALTLGLHNSMCLRYEVEFAPALVLLAVVGILALERALAAPTSESGRADQPFRRRAARWGWGSLLGFSVAFNLLASVERYAETDNNLGIALERAGRVQEAMVQYEQALRLNPNLAAAHYNLGVALARMGRVPEAVEHYEQALRLMPDLAAAHYNLGTALARLGRVPEAIEHYEGALRLQPWDPDAHYNLGMAMERAGRVQEAIGQYEQTLRIKPDLVEAHYNLGVALARLGRVPEAVGHWEQVLRLKPDYAEAHNNLGNALAQVGKVPEAIEHYEEALRLDPYYADAQYNLGLALEQSGQIGEAIAHYEQALRLRPDYAEAHNNLGSALARLGRVPEAIGHWEQALRIKPDYARAHYNLGTALEEAGRVPEAIGHYEQALRLKPDFTEVQNRLTRLRTAR